VEPGSPTPLYDLFRRGEAPREVRLLAAQGGVASQPHEQLLILVLVASDREPDIAAAAARTLDALPGAAVAAFLGRPDAPGEVRAYFAARGLGASAAASVPQADLERELEAALAGPAADPPPDDEPAARQPISMLPVIERMKLAMRGTREQRATLIRDANKLVAVSVLSSPKVTESEIEVFARMANVSEEVLRIIGSNRHWTRSYAVLAALTRNPKTPPTVSMPLVARLTERDLRGLSIDRNVPEGLRIAARKLVVNNESRRR
jgi:hypothetical protein